MVLRRNTEVVERSFVEPGMQVATVLVCGLRCLVARQSGLSGAPDHFESECPCRGCLAPIMGAEHKKRLAAFSEEQRAGEMDRVERLDDCGHWLACSPKNFRGQANRADGALGRQERLMSICQPEVTDCSLQTQAVNCAPRLDAHQLT